MNQNFFLREVGGERVGQHPLQLTVPSFFNFLKYLQMMSALELPIPDGSLSEDVRLYISEAFQEVEATGIMAPKRGDNPFKKHQQSTEKEERNVTATIPFLRSESNISSLLHFGCFSSKITNSRLRTQMYFWSNFLFTWTVAYFSRGEKRLPEICLRLQATCGYFQIFYVIFFGTLLIMVMLRNAPSRINFKLLNNY